MANRKRNNNAWKQFEERIVEKRGAAGTSKNEQPKPEDIMVQRMAEFPTGRLKKFEPLEPREFVPFSEFTCLSLENIKTACEEHFNMPEGTCDILSSNQGPSCTRFDQIKAKKIYLIRFIQSDHPEYSSRLNRQTSSDNTPSEQNQNAKKRKANPNSATTVTKSKFAPSISIADLLKAGKVIQKKFLRKSNSKNLIFSPWYGKITGK